MIKNKKAQTSMLRKIVIAILIMIVLTIIFSNMMSSSNNSLRCKKGGGVCADSCNMYTQYQYIGGKAGGCAEEQVCCVSITQPKPADSRCAKLTIGQECDKTLGLMYCDSSNQCVSKCELCSANFNTPEIRIICNTPKTTTIFEDAAKNNQKLSCACTQQDLASRGASGYIKGYCPNEDNANGLTCCTVPK